MTFQTERGAERSEKTIQTFEFSISFVFQEIQIFQRFQFSRNKLTFRIDPVTRTLRYLCVGVNFRGNERIWSGTN